MRFVFDHSIKLTIHSLQMGSENVKNSYQNGCSVPYSMVSEKNHALNSSPNYTLGLEKNLRWGVGEEFTLKQSLAMPVKVQFLERQVETESWGFYSFEQRSEYVKG